MPRFPLSLPGLFSRRSRAGATAFSSAVASAVESLEPRRLMAVFDGGNTRPINIYNGDFVDPLGRADPYPSSAGMGGIEGTIQSISLTLLGFQHDSPEDVDIYLLSPSNKAVMLMSDAGSVFPVEGLDITFTTDSFRDLPETTPLRSGTYRATDYDGGDGDDIIDDVGRGTLVDSLADLLTEDPNGLWHLYVADDNFQGGEGWIPSGWALTITTGGEGPPAPSTPNLVNASDTGSSNTDNITSDETPTFSGTATEGTQVYLYVDGIRYGTADIVGGAYNVTADTGLSDGEHRITARAVNAAGDTGDASGELIIEVDTTAPPFPDVPDLAPESDLGASNEDNITWTTATLRFNGTGEAGSTVTILADDTIVLGSGPVDASGNYSVTSTRALAVGTYDIKAGQVDVAGNRGQLSSPLSLTIEQGQTSLTTVTQVFVNGQNLTSNAAFRGAAGADQTFGFPVPDGVNQLRPVPWVNGVNAVSIRFSQDVTGSLAQGDLVVRGSAGPLTVSAFTYDAATRTGTWTLSAPVTNDKLRLVLAAAGVAGLDGEWTNPTAIGQAGDTYPSGNAAVGGDFNFRVNVLRGDATGDGTVNALDLADVKRRLGRRPGDGTTGAGGYSIFSDITMDGVVNALDLAAVKQRLGNRLPTAEPA